jgi:hypothetical protein
LTSQTIGTLDIKRNPSRSGVGGAIGLGSRAADIEATILGFSDGGDMIQKLNGAVDWSNDELKIYKLNM